MIRYEKKDWYIEPLEQALGIERGVGGCIVVMDWD
jgi:hypothetical protein